MPVPSTEQSSMAMPFLCDNAKGGAFSSTNSTVGQNVSSNISKRTHKLSARLANDQASIQRMQRLLLLLRHASRCRGSSRFSETDSPHSNGGCCVYAHCNSMKKLWIHINQCPYNAAGSGNRGRSCNVPNCNRSRYALWHYKHCEDGHACPVCGPFKIMIRKEAEAMEKQKVHISSAVEGNDHDRYRSFEQADEKNQRDGEQLRKRQRVSLSLTPRTEEQNVMDEVSKMRCTMIINQMLSHENGWVFSSPVDPDLLNIPDYFDVVKRPMDLGTIQEQLNRSCYNDITDFRDDVLLTFDNAILYNMEGTEVYDMAVDLKRQFVSQFQLTFGL